MPGFLVDSNILLDVLTADPCWFEWSSTTLSSCAESGPLAIDPIIYAEVSIRFEHIEELEQALPHEYFRRLPLPWEAAFLAGKCFLRYRRDGGVRSVPLPDFFIGAHALVRSLILVTRDPRRYRTCFPALRLVAPD